MSSNNSSSEEPSAAKQRSVEALDKIMKRRLECTEEGLQNLAAYKYKASEYTPLDNLLNRFVWIPTSECVPKWLAPNAITLLGLIVMVTGACVVSYHSPEMRSSVPRWASAYVGFTVFAYQTLDAVDGKQARKTGSSSPLGQLFDHGCDCASTTLLGLIGSTLLQLGFGRSIFFLLSLQMQFWFMQWAEYHTHVLPTNVGGVIGCTEAQMTWIIVSISCMYNPDFWTSELPIQLPTALCRPNSSCSMEWNEVVVGLVLLCGCLPIGSAILSVAKSNSNRIEAFLQAIPVVSLAFLSCAWVLVLPRSHPRLAFLSIGGTYTYLTCKMIVAAMSQIPYQAFHTIIIPFPFIFVIFWKDVLPRHEEVILGAYASYVAYKTFKYVQNVIEELSHYLGIYAFTLGARVDSKEQTRGRDEAKGGKTRTSSPGAAGNLKAD